MSEKDIELDNQLMVEENNNDAVNLQYDKQEVNYPYKNEKGKKLPSIFTRFVKRTFDLFSSLTLL